MSGIRTLLLAVTLTLALAGPAACGIVLRGRLSQAEGVRWAAGELRKAHEARGAVIPRITVELTSKSLGVGDGYTLAAAGPGTLLQAHSEGAAIYGLLDLRDRVERGLTVPRTLKFTPALQFRASSDTFPFWIGTTMYSNFWKLLFEKTEMDPKYWWRDRPGWTARFREMAGRRVNALVLNHPHPYPALLVYDRFQEAQHYPPEWAKRNADDFAWIVREGRKYGVSIYFLTWNIVVPPAFAKAHSVEEFGSQAQVVKDYTRYCVRKLFDTYPGLGGLVTMGAETPVGCTDWVIENVVSAMNQCSPRPKLIWWGWCTYPEDSLKVMKAYKGRTDVAHYLQYEQFFKPMADPRIGRWSRETGGTRMIALGGPKSALGYYTWGDPDWARETVRSLKEDNNGSGLLLETYITAPWLAREAFCRYMWDLSGASSRNQDEWEWRTGKRYSPEVAEPLLACYKAASRIIPRFLCLVHSQSDHFQPQLGLPLVYYLGMPSLSTYFFEWYDGVDSRGRLVPNYGLTWPNPDWGEKVLTILQYAQLLARGKTHFTSTTPPQIADQIEAASAQCLEILPKLEKLRPANNAGEYDQTLKLLRMNAYWGMQAAWKIRAAVAWASFRECASGSAHAGRAGDYSEECVKSMERSLDWYRKLAEQANVVYPNPAHFWLSFLASPPPWKQNDIWYSYRLVSSHWREMLPRYERELEVVKQQLALGPKSAALPLTDVLWQEPETRVLATFDFDDDKPGLLLESTTYTTDPEQVISGKRSLLLDSRRREGEWHMLLKTKPAELLLEPGRRYQVRFRYRVVSNPNRFSQTFAVAARSDTAGWQRDSGTFPTWSAPTGASGERVVQIEPKDHDDYYLFILIHGPGVLVVDDITVAEIAAK